MTNTELRAFSDAELQSIIDRAKNEQQDRIRRRYAETEKAFWNAAKKLYAANHDYNFSTYINGDPLPLAVLLNDAGMLES